MNLKTTVTVFSLAVAFVRADIIFDVSFEDPPHMLGTYTSTGPAPYYPSTGAAYVENVPGFSSQAGLVGGSLSFIAPVSYSSGVHVISWDFMNLSENTLGIGPNAAFFISSSSDYDLFLAHGVLGGVTLFESGAVSVYDGPYAVSNFATYTFVIDMDALVYDFAINGTNVITASSLPTSMTSLDSAVFLRPGNNDFAIDNFRWEIVPEPSTLVLISLGILGVCGRRFLKTKTAGQ